MAVLVIGSNGAIVLPPVVEAAERAAGNVITLFHSTKERIASDSHWKQRIAMRKNAPVGVSHLYLIYHYYYHYFYNISIDNNRILSANLVLISKSNFYKESKTTRARWATAIWSL